MTAHSSRLGAAVKVLAGALGLAVTVVGVPWALVTWVGNPLAWLGSLASPAQQLSDSAVLQVLACVVWLAWAYWTWCVLIEALAAIRGASMPQLPGWSRPGQLAARMLISWVLLAAVVIPTVASHVSPASAAAVPPPSTPAIALVHATGTAATTRAGQGTPVVSSSAARTTAAPEAGHRDRRPVYHVHRGDSLWDIAETHLGDGLRWREIYDLNAHHVQPDGQRLRDADLIYPGWRLVLPDDAVGVRHRDTTDPDRHPGKDPGRQVTPSQRPTRPGHTARPTQHPSAPASTVPTAASPAPTAGDREQHVTAAGQHSATPWVGTGLAIGVLAAGIGVGLAGLRRRQYRHRRPGRRIKLPAPAARRTERRLQAVDRRRAVEALDAGLRGLSARLADSTAPMPDPIAARLGADRLDLLLVDAVDAPEPWRGDGRLWHLDLPVEPSGEAGDEDLPAGVAPWLSGTQHAIAPLPALATVGTLGATGELLMLDLERVGVLAVAGDPDHAAGLLRALAAELAWNAWSDDVEVTLVGDFTTGDPFGDTVAEQLVRLNPGRIRHAESFAAVAARIEHRIRGVQAVLDRHGLPDTFTGRIRDVAADTWTPQIVVLAAAPPSGEDRRRLDAIAETITRHRGRAAVAIVVAGDYAAADWTLDVAGDGRLTVPSLHVTDAHVHALPVEGIAPLVELLETARTGGDEPIPPADDDADWARDTDGAGGLLPGGDPVAAEPADAAPDRVAASPSVQRLPEHLALVRPASGDAATALDERRAVRTRPDQDPCLDEDLAAWHGDTTRPKVYVLGRVHVDAGGPPPDRRRDLTVEIAAYLATRTRGVTAGELDTAIWPDERRSPSYRRSLLSGVRKWLDTTPDGTPYLPHQREGADATSGTYALREDVLLDWQLFRRLRVRSGTADADPIADLHAALDLVTGAPFEHHRPRGYGWLTESGLEHTIFAAVVDVAHELVDWALADGDTETARWAAERARLCDVHAAADSPLCDLMRIAVAEDKHEEARALAAHLVEIRDLEVEEDLPPATYTVLNGLHLLPTAGTRATG